VVAKCALGRRYQAGWWAVENIEYYYRLNCAGSIADGECKL